MELSLLQHAKDKAPRQVTLDDVVFLPAAAGTAPLFPNQGQCQQDEQRRHHSLIQVGTGMS